MLKHLIIVRGGGDLATGTISRLHNCGFPVLVLECARPTAIRRTVAFSEAVYTGSQTVEGLTCCRAETLQQAVAFLRNGKLPLIVDETGDSIAALRPMAVVDAILAKRNLGTHRGMAPITVGLGPGFTAGADVDAVVETMRGHDLGRVLYQGAALPNTGVPGPIAGHAADRVIHSPAAGQLRAVRRIGDQVREGETLAYVGDAAVTATLTGLLRGLIRDGFPVTEGMKIADIDPRIEEQKNCATISDKARCIAGGALEAVLHLHAAKGLPW